MVEVRAAVAGLADIFSVGVVDSHGPGSKECSKESVGELHSPFPSYIGFQERPVSNVMDDYSMESGQFSPGSIQLVFSLAQTKKVRVQICALAIEAKDHRCLQRQGGTAAERSAGQRGENFAEFWPKFHIWQRDCG